MLAILDLTHQDPEARFTTREVAEQMGADEYPVRAAFSWLVRCKKIEVVRGEIRERVTRTAGEKYPVAVYRFKPKSESGDFAALYQVFGLAPTGAGSRDAAGLCNSHELRAESP